MNDHKIEFFFEINPFSPINIPHSRFYRRQPPAQFRVSGQIVHKRSTMNRQTATAINNDPSSVHPTATTTTPSQMEAVNKILNDNHGRTFKSVAFNKQHYEQFDVYAK